MPRPPRFSLLPLVFALLLAGCASAPLPQLGRLTERGFESMRYDYHVGLDQEGRLVGEGWVLDNYSRSADDPFASPKRTEAYRHSTNLDFDDDGETDAKVEAFTYDLRFRHRRHAGVIWLRTLIVGSRLAGRDLSALIATYVDRASGSAYAFGGFGNPEVGVSRTYATTIVEQGAISIGDQPAHAATFDVANVDQLRLDPDHRSERVRVAILRTPFLDAAAAVERNRRLRNGDGIYSVFMIAGYANQPDHFDEGLAAFESLVERVRFDDSAGIQELLSGAHSACGLPDHVRVGLGTMRDRHGHSGNHFIPSVDISEAQNSCIVGWLQGMNVPEARGVPFFFGAWVGGPPSPPVRAARESAPPAPAEAAEAAEADVVAIESVGDVDGADPSPTTSGDGRVEPTDESDGD